MTILQELGDPLWTAQALSFFSFLASAQMQPERALVLEAAAQAQRGQSGSAGAFPSYTTERQATFQRMLELVGPERADAASEKGHKMTLDGAIEYALCCSFDRLLR